MTQKPKDTDLIDGEQPPSGIPTKDWAKTPASVRKLIASQKESDQEGKVKPENRLPALVVLFLNLVIVGVATFLLGNRVTLPCVTPYQASALSVVSISLIIFHLIWRSVFSVMPKKTEGTVKFAIITIPLSGLIGILNEIHPWKLTSRLLGTLLLIFLVSGVFLNLSSYSPLYKGGEPFAIQGFAVQRLNSPSEQLASGETLTMTAGEKVFLEVVLLGDTQVSCTWFIVTNGNNTETGCSIAYGALTPGEDDILSVFVQPACGSRQESANLLIAVQP